MAAEFYAFGDCLIFDTLSADAKSPPPPSRRGTKAKPPTVFTLPVRSKAHSALASPKSSLAGVDAAAPVVDAAESVDAIATILLAHEKTAEQGCEPSRATFMDGRGAVTSQHGGGKVGHPLKEGMYARSTSFDTSRPQPAERDQCPGQSAAEPPTSASASVGMPGCPQQRPSLQSQGSLTGSRCSGGGAGHVPHNTEWWRSFSSSRLNELAVDEPNLRSAEMRHVPYVGGAAPMCALVHGPEEQQ